MWQVPLLLCAIACAATLIPSTARAEQGETARPGAGSQLTAGFSATKGDDGHADEVLRKGHFVGIDGRAVAFEPAYDSWFGDRREPHYFRAAVEMLGWVGLGTIHYWLQLEQNQEDWDRPNVIDRFNFQAVRFDNNEMLTNNLLHPLAGAAYYGFARVNNLKPYEAFAYSFATSAVWEWALEWHEQVSINDIIITPIGGMAMGEFLYQLGEYLNSAPGGGGTAQKAGAVTLGLPRYVHQLIDRDPPPPALPADALGFSSAFWHRFVLGYEASWVENDAGRNTLMHSLVAEGDIVAMPGFLRPGAFAKTFTNGNFTSMRVRSGFTHEEGLAELDLDFRTDFAGHYHQDFEWKPDGAHGHAMMVAASTALRYADLWLFDRRDQFAIGHILGPSIRLWSAWHDVWFRSSARASVDFASIRSLAFPEWSYAHDPDGVKTVLDKHGYQMTFGGSGELSAGVGYRGLEVGASASFGQYESVEGVDRWQEQVTGDVHGSEWITERSAWVGYTAAEAPIAVRLSVNDLERRSAIEAVDVERWDRRFGGLIATSF